MADTFAYAERTTCTYSSSVVAKVLTIDPPDLKRAMVDKTVLGDEIKTARASRLKEVGEMKLTLQYDSSAHGVFLTDLETPAEKGLVITFYADGETAIETWTWTKAIVSGVKVGNIDQDKNVEADITFSFNDWPTIS